MPKDLFFSISEDKRKRLIDAATQEFSSHLFYDASINRIVKSAKISRGSFYQYFEDKEDLVLYIVESHLKKKVEEFFVAEKMQNFDIYEMHRMIFVKSIESKDKYNILLKMLYISMDQSLRQRFEKIRDDMFKNILKTEFSVFIEKYKDRMEEFQILNKMLGSISMGLNGMMVGQHFSKKEILRIYDIQIKIIKGEIRF